MGRGHSRWLVLPAHCTAILSIGCSLRRRKVDLVTGDAMLGRYGAKVVDAGV